MTRTRKDVVLIVAVLAAILVAGLTLSTANAAAAVTVDVNARIRAADNYEKGDIVAASTTDVPAEWVGQACIVTYTSGNNSSIHDGTGLQVVTGQATATLADVESAPGATFVGSGPVVLGATVRLSVILGESTIASVVGTVVFDCDPHTTPPTVTVPPTVTTPPTTPPTVTTPPTTPPTVTAPPPVVVCETVSDVPDAAKACEYTPELTG